jgi:hypothetical protein
LKYLHGLYAIKSHMARQAYNMIVESVLHDRKKTNLPRRRKYHISRMVEKST